MKRNPSIAPVRLLVPLVCLCAFAGMFSGAAGLSAQEVSERSVAPESVVVRLVVHEASGETRHYDLLTTTDGSPRRLSQGSRVPIPVTTQNVGPDRAPVTSYQYQDIGFSAEVRVSRVDGADFRIQARVEDSLLADSPQSGHPPHVEHLTQELQALVPLGAEVDATSLSTGSDSGYRVTLELTRPVG